MNEKLAIAAHILNGICAGDWKLDISETTWDEVAIKRALELAELLINKCDEHDRPD